MASKHKFSKEHRAYLAACARARSVPMRPVDRKPGGNTDAKAREYALWLLRRDGLDLAAMAKHASKTHKLSPGASVTAQVAWYPCAAGMRPRFVMFHLEHRLVREPIQLVRVELPNWSFEAVDLNADDAPLALAA